MKIRIKLNIELKEGVFEGSWGNSVLDWQECWLKTEYINDPTCDWSFKVYIYPDFWKEEWMNDGWVMYCDNTKDGRLKEWIKEVEEYLNKNFSL